MRVSCVLPYSAVPPAVAMNGPGPFLDPASHPTRAERRRLPYGMWTRADGSEVLFDRCYRPIWGRQAGGPAVPADPTAWVRFVRQVWFYTGSTPEPDCRQAGLDALAVWGVS